MRGGSKSPDQDELDLALNEAARSDSAKRNASSLACTR